MNRSYRTQLKCIVNLFIAIICLPNWDEDPVSKIGDFSGGSLQPDHAGIVERPILYPIRTIETLVERSKPPNCITTRQRSRSTRKVSIKLFIFCTDPEPNVSLTYFFNDLDHLLLPDYNPSVQDIPHSRFRTSGIREMSFWLKELEMVVIDVGGQKSERRKRMHCFQDVTAILFIASLSGYDQCLVLLRIVRAFKLCD